MNWEKDGFYKRVDELKELNDQLQRDNTKLMKDYEKLKVDKKKNTSFIRGNQTTFITREIPPENKENSQLQMKE